MKPLNVVLAAGLALALVGAPCAEAATPWNLSVTVKASDYDPTVPGGVSVYVVPAGETLLLTDVVMTHNVSTTSATFRANIRRGPASNSPACATASAVLLPYVSPAETVSLNLSSPLRFQAGEQICIVIGGASGTDGVTFSLIGIQP